MLAGAAVLLSEVASAQPVRAEFEAQGAAYAVLKRFDFDERSLGNYEDTPMYWSRLRGEGLPTYCGGRFDDERGHNGPPSFRLDVQAGNVCYEYSQLDLTVIPGSDYFVRAYVRAVGLVHSRAFVAAFFVDRFNEPIAGTQRVSQLVSSTGARDEPWQAVEVMLSGDAPSAYALRLQLWVLHAYTWRTTEALGVDPIIRRDVRGSAWFDDVTVYRLPRARLRLSGAGNVATEGEPASLLIELNQSGTSLRGAELRVVDDLGRPRLERTLELLDDAGVARLRQSQRASGEPTHSAATRVELPPLEPGSYSATLRVRSQDDEVLERRTRFAVVAPARDSSHPPGSFGVTLPELSAEDGIVVGDLSLQLGVRTAKLTVPVRGRELEANDGHRLDRLARAARSLQERSLELVGVIAPDSRDAGGSLRDWIDADPQWASSLSPMLAQLGGSIQSWQLGLESAELRGVGVWSDDQIRRVREHVRRFVSVPELIVPLRVTAPEIGTADAASVWIPPAIPTRSLPEALQFLRDARKPVCLHVDPALTDLDDRTAVEDYARRLVLAHAAGAERVYFPAPFSRETEAGGRHWEPDSAFVALRSVVRLLSGKRATAVMQLPEDVLAILFVDREESCLVIWTWRDRATGKARLYLGNDPVAVDLRGRRSPLRVIDGRTEIPVAPSPLFVQSTNSALAVLQAGVRFENSFLERHRPEPRPAITFQNPFAEVLSGELVVQAPIGWDVTPTAVRFDLAPGETLRQELTFALPPRPASQGNVCTFVLRLMRPERVEMEFAEPVRVGLQDVEISAISRWQGAALVVEQTLRNRSADAVSFKGYCDSAGRRRLESVFVDINPGEVVTHAYLIPEAADLAGGAVYVGAEELNGRRTLHQQVAVPSLGP